MGDSAENIRECVDFRLRLLVVARIVAGATVLCGGHTKPLAERLAEVLLVLTKTNAAGYLVEHGVKLIGVDYLSIEEYKKPGRPAHHALLQAGVVIVEGLCLADVPAGDYELLCLPLKLKDADGAPARVILREMPFTAFYELT